MPEVGEILNRGLYLTDAKSLTNVGLAHSRSESRLHAREVHASHRALCLLLSRYRVMQLGFLTDYVTAVEDNVEVLDFILLLLNYFDIFFRDMLSLNAKESQRFELFEI